MDISNDELRAFLNEIDALFSDKDIAIHNRPIQAIAAFGKKYSVSIPIVTDVIRKHGGPSDLLATAHISDFISDWYDDKYGELIKLDFKLGKTVVKLAKNYYQLDIPKHFTNQITLQWNPNGPMERRFSS